MPTFAKSPRFTRISSNPVLPAGKPNRPSPWPAACRITARKSRHQPVTGPHRLNRSRIPIAAKRASSPNPMPPLTVADLTTVDDDNNNRDFLPPESTPTTALETVLRLPPQDPQFMYAELLALNKSLEQHNRALEIINRELRKQREIYKSMVSMLKDGGRD
jgi:hypothetical protein